MVPGPRKKNPAPSRHLPLSVARPAACQAQPRAEEGRGPGRGMWPQQLQGLTQSRAQLWGGRAREQALGRASAPPARLQLRAPCPGRPVQPGVEPRPPDTWHWARPPEARHRKPGQLPAEELRLRPQPPRPRTAAGSRSAQWGRCPGARPAGPPRSVRWGQKAHSALAERARTPPPRPGCGRPCPDPGSLQWHRGCHVAHAGLRWPGGALRPCTAPLPPPCLLRGGFP